MKKQSLIRPLKNSFFMSRFVAATIVVSVFLVCGFLVKNTIAQTWSEPTAPPPGNNVSAPIWNQTSTAQSGSFYVNGKGRFDTTGTGDANCTNSKVCGVDAAGVNGLVGKSNTGYGVYASSTSNYGLVASSSTNYAGYFSGNVYTFGTLNATAGLQVNGTNVCLSNGTNCPSSGGYWSASGNNIYNNNSGNIGIGTTAPTTPLNVEKDVNTSAENWIATLQNNNTESNTPTAGLLFAVGDSNSQKGGIIFRRTGAYGVGDIFFLNNPTVNSSKPTIAANAVMALKSTGNVGIGTTSPGALLSLGTAGTKAGTLSFAGGSSGTVTVQPASAAGTWTLTLPTNDGNSGQYLQTNGSGVTTWATIAAAGGTVTSSGNSPYVPLFTSATNIGNSVIQQSGTNIGIGVVPTYKLHVSGTIYASGTVYSNGSAVCQSNGTNCPSSSSQWTTNGTSIYYNGGNVGIGKPNPSSGLMVANKGLFVGTGSSEGYYGAAPAGHIYVTQNDNALLDMYAREGVSYVSSNGYLSLSSGWGGNITIGSGSTTINTNLAFIAAYPTISTGGGYLTIPGGAYFNSLPVYTEGRINARGGLYDDVHGALYIGGGTWGQTNFGGDINASSIYGTYWVSTQNLESYGDTYVGRYVYAADFIYNSDRRLKNNIVSLDDNSGLSVIKQLNPVSFNWKDEIMGVGTKYGFIAQDMQKVLPSIVSENPQTGMLSIGYNGLIAPMVKSIQEQQKEIDDQKQQQEDRDQELQNEINNLRQQILELKTK